MQAMKRLTAILPFLIIPFFYGCGTGPISGGTSTSENGRVAGIVVDNAGAAVSRAEVLLIPADYNPVRETEKLCRDTTDSSGAFLFSGVHAGEYTVQSSHVFSGTKALTRDVNVDSVTDSVFVGSCALNKPGSVRIAVPSEARTGSSYFYIPGTTSFISYAEGETYAVIDSVPIGVVESIVLDFVDSAESAALVYEANVVIISEDTATLLSTAWSHAKILKLNSTATGADIQETLYGFPVLIRLNDGNFDFSHASDDGKDLLFSKADGVDLPHEIERWDAENRVAEIWVGIDTLPGDSVLEIGMYWGNPGVLAVSKEGGVFDTAAGFSAVWHLSEGDDTVYDATVNRFHGLRHGNLAASSGVIGNCQVFGGSEAYCEMGDVVDFENKSFTLSAWIKRSKTGLQTIVSKSPGGEPSVSYGWNLTFGETDIIHFFAATKGESWGDTGAFDLWSRSSESDVGIEVWHNIAVVFDPSGSPGSIYLDGSAITSEIRGDITSVGSLVNGAPLRIGLEADGDCQYEGSIDECVISHRARSADWIRLCFINQSPDDRLVEYE